MSKTRRYFTAAQKAGIVRRYLAGKKAVSDLADEFGVQPSLIHGWINQVLAQAERALDRPSGKRRLEEAQERKIAFLEAKLANKNEVIAELMQEHYNHVRLNSAIGYLTPADKLNGLAQVIFDERDRKLEEARQRRQQARHAAREVA